MAAPAGITSDSVNLIATSVELCARGFVSLVESLTPETRFSAQIPALKVKDEFDRFKLWAGNIAAHRKGRRSLEYRLRDAAHLKTETLRLLESLTGTLQDALDIVQGKKIPWDEIDYSDSDSESSSSDDGHTTTSLQGSTELKQLFASAQTVVKALFRLSMAIRDPAPNSQSTSTINIDKTFFEQHDIMHVKAKFPEAAEYLSERLGRAISGRRQYLSYREEHHQKLAKNVEKIGFERPTTEFTTNSTEATPIPGIDRSNSLNVLDDGEDSLSQTSYATSVNAAIRVPPLPKEAKERDSFECPLCFMIVSIKTTVAWKQHVYRDLHPYCCTFEDCTTADRLYDSRHAWFAHENEAHRTSWLCVEGCARTFENLFDFQEHVRTRHAELNNLISALKRTSAKRASLAEQVHCQLCNARMSLRALQRHVGKHQQQLALFALPPSLDDTEDDPDDEDDSKRVDDSDNSLSDIESITQPTEPSDELTLDSQHGEEGSEDDESKRCVCNEPLSGNMIRCDNTSCPHRWYHFECVGLANTTIPDGEWFCRPQCRKASEKRKKSTSEASDENKTYATSASTLQDDPYSALSTISKDFEQKYKPMCLDFIAHPPDDEGDRIKSYKRLESLILWNTITQCDDIIVNEDDGSRALRRELVKKAQDLISWMESIARKQVNAATEVSNHGGLASGLNASRSELPVDGEASVKPDHMRPDTFSATAEGASNQQPDDTDERFKIQYNTEDIEQNFLSNRVSIGEAKQEFRDVPQRRVSNQQINQDPLQFEDSQTHADWMDSNKPLESITQWDNQRQSGEPSHPSGELHRPETSEATAQEREGPEQDANVEGDDDSKPAADKHREGARRSSLSVQGEDDAGQSAAAASSQHDLTTKDSPTQNQESQKLGAEERRARVEDAKSSSFRRPTSPYNQNLSQQEAKDSGPPDKPASQIYRPTYPKINSTYLDVETLHYYDIPYILDPQDPSYFLIQREMTVEETDVLFEHTRRLRDKGRRRIFKSAPNETESSKSAPRRRHSNSDTEARGFGITGFKEPEAEDRPRRLFEAPAKPPGYKPTYVKIHKQHIEAETLLYYDLPFRDDAQDPDYIIIYQELTEEEADVLFKHTRRLRAGRSGDKAPRTSNNRESLKNPVKSGLEGTPPDVQSSPREPSPSG